MAFYPRPEYGCRYRMHGNTPYDGATDADHTPEQRRALRRDCVAIAARARELLPDEFVVGTEVTEDASGARATVAVQPPGGSVITAQFSPDDGTDTDDVATELAAGAALEAIGMPEGDRPAA